MARPKSGYRLADGTRVPGVTTFTGRFKDSGALMHWAFKQGRLAEQGVIQSLYDKAEQAADIGTVVHDWIEADLRGNPLPTVDLPEGDIEKAQAAFDSYMRWRQFASPEPHFMEEPLVSEQWRFGGTPDCPAIIHGKPALLDWKTSKGFYRDMVVQLGAYRELLREVKDFHAERAYVARFDKGGRFSFHELTAADLDLGWEQFKLFLQAYDNDKRLKEIAA